jgi:hypothetical protein
MNYLKRIIITTALLMVGQAAVLAQVVRLSGKVLEEGNNAAVAGATVRVSERSNTVTTDVEGRFFLDLEKGRKYKLTISSMGFQTKELADLQPENGANLDISLVRAKSKEMESIVITSSARKESVASVYSLQKNSSSISDGISAEAIRKSPDLNTGDVLKRVSGASVQDNKFVIVRGLNERYNVSLLNNAVLPSTEPDKKAFAFDIIPSPLIDNLVVYKTATPDLPGDFSGGAIKVNTKDYPTHPISELTLGMGYNTLTTFKNFYKGFPDGKLDAIGFFDGSREIPSSYTPYRGSAFINLDAASKQAITKDFGNNFGHEPALRSYPNFGFVYTGGNTRILKRNRKLGYVFTLGYISSRKTTEHQRSDYQIDKFLLYQNRTDNYDQRNQLSALFNLTYAYHRSKISWKNLFNNDFSRGMGIRNGYDRSNDPYTFQYKSENSEATGNGLFNSVFEGLHNLGSKWKLDWNGSVGYTYRHQPDQKVLTFRTPNNDSSTYYIKLANENSPEIRNAGRVFSNLKEFIYGANANFTYDLPGRNKSKLKFGLSNYLRDRKVVVDALGYSTLDAYGVTIYETKDQTFNNLFEPANIDRYRLVLATIGTNSTDYNAQALMNGGYAMFDGFVSDHFKVTGGVRVERYAQQLKALNQATIKKDDIDVLPSFLLTWSVNSKTNIRLAGSQAVNRPEFRELANYSVFDYDNYNVIRGNPLLQRSKNTNGDLRYEYFPGSGEIISASLFYKYFDHPIEQVNSGNDVLSYENATQATAYGAELEIRKRLSFIGGDLFDRLTFYTNLAYIRGSVKFGTVNFNSPLQGQSPYLLNAGLTYTTPNDGFSFNILYNRIGPRLKYRAVSGGALNIFENSRDLLDAQVSKKIMKDRVELKLTISDIFAQPFNWYYKFEADPASNRFDPASDKVINSVRLGTTFMLKAKINLNK